MCRTIGAALNAVPVHLMGIDPTGRLLENQFECEPTLSGFCPPQVILRPGSVLFHSRRPVIGSVRPRMGPRSGTGQPVIGSHSGTVRPLIGNEPTIWGMYPFEVEGLRGRRVRSTSRMLRGVATVVTLSTVLTGCLFSSGSGSGSGTSGTRTIDGSTTLPGAPGSAAGVAPTVADTYVPGQPAPTVPLAEAQAAQLQAASSTTSPVAATPVAARADHVDARYLGKGPAHPGGGQPQSVGLLAGQGTANGPCCTPRPMR